MWGVIQNNLVAPSLYLVLRLLDFCLCFMYTILIYDSRNCIPDVLQILKDVLDMKLSPETLGVVCLLTGSIMVLHALTIGILVVKRFSWQVYNEKSFILQTMSIKLSLMSTCLFTPLVLVSLHSFLTFDKIENIYLRYLSLLSSILTSILLFFFTYLSAYLHTLYLPSGDPLPWSSTSCRLSLVHSLSRLLLTLTLVFRYYHHLPTPILYTLPITSIKPHHPYPLTVATFLAYAWGLQLSVIKAYSFSESLGMLEVALQAAIMHMLLFGLALIVGEGQITYGVWCSVAMPVTIASSVYARKRAEKGLWTKILEDGSEEQISAVMRIIKNIEIYESDTLGMTPRGREAE
jgi:hypothetical protein